VNEGKVMSSKAHHEVVELFGVNTGTTANWQSIVEKQQCPYSGGRCFKIRKSDSGTSIGTCTVRTGSARDPLLICPNRLLEGGHVFGDCLHLLTRHQPGNELHVIPEISVPGGSVDYFLVTAARGKPVDFVGIEFQTLDTTGTVWPARQRFLQSVGVDAPIPELDANKPYGVNWKMTAKTILMQLHHKIETFEALGRNFVLVVQTPFMEYMKGEFEFGHLTNPAVVSEPMHFHAYGAIESGAALTLQLDARYSTNAPGIAKALNLGAAAVVDESRILDAIASKMSPKTRWAPVTVR
jgi:hypothetical protein